MVQDVSLEVTSGEVVGLLGPNGAGKTTCFYMIVGLVAVDAGRIELDGAELTHLPIHRRARLGLSYLPQENSIFRRLTRRGKHPGRARTAGPAGRTRSKRASANCSRTCTSPICASTPAISLSGGERRRVEIARALGTQPALHPARRAVRRASTRSRCSTSSSIIRFLKERGIGVLITDHNVRETLGICDRAYIINEGAVLASGQPDEIVYNDSVRQVYLGENFRL